MTSAIAVDTALMIARIEEIEALRRLADALTDVPYFFSMDEAEAMQHLSDSGAIDADHR